MWFSNSLFLLKKCLVCFITFPSPLHVHKDLSINYYALKAKPHIIPVAIPRRVRARNSSLIVDYNRKLLASKIHIYHIRKRRPQLQMTLPRSHGTEPSRLVYSTAAAGIVPSCRYPPRFHSQAQSLTVSIDVFGCCHMVSGFNNQFIALIFLSIYSVALSTLCTNESQILSNY